MCARQDCFVFERLQVVFYCKSANLIGRIVFDAARQTRKMNQRRFFLNDACTRGVFRIGVHSHIGAPLFSHEALNVGEYRARNSSWCVRGREDDKRAKLTPHWKCILKQVYYTFNCRHIIINTAVINEI